MKTRASMKNRQRGAVAVMVGASLVLLVGFLALVIDLSHLHIVKTELQNAADAAALSGAKQLDGTLLRVNDTTGNNNGAVQWAIATAAKNSYDFSLHPVDITIADIWVGDCPDDGCMVPASSITTNAAAAGKTFLKVDTRSRSLAAWFAPIWNILNTSTYGMAVAGKYIADVSAVGICELPDDDDNPNVTELGYERGVSYRVSDANPIAKGTPFWINPKEMAPTPCVPSHGSESVTLDYICTGKMDFTPVAGQKVYANTGTTTPQLEALDSRFNVYTSQNKCSPLTAPPDSNIKQYIYNDSGTGQPRRWMNPDPAQQSISFTTIGGTNQPKPWNTRSFSDYGVLWSASRPVVAANDTTDALASTRWTSLYNAPASAVTSYPQPSPYAQSGVPFFEAPLINTPTPGRRMLNMAIVDCEHLVKNKNCQELEVEGIGRFFMQKKANVSGDKDIYVEFAGLLPTPLPPSYIRLYR